MKKIFFYLFLIVSAGVIISTLTDAPLVHLVCKPAIMFTLGLYYWMTQHSRQESKSVPLVVAIIFSCAGDVLLMLQQMNPDFFMVGLGAFLVAHVFYIFAYKQHQGVESTEELQGLRKIRFALPIVLSGTGLITILYNHLGNLKIPVVIYACVLTYMVLVALFRFGKTNIVSFTMVFGGAILFMISDSLIAINKFLEPLSMANFWVMITYISAQFLIVSGILKHGEQ
jgi:uncharacterized membrane protein YhhN